jgi:hypothetical protein
MIFDLRVLLLQAHPDSLSRKRGGRLEFEETYSPSKAGRPPKSRVAQLKGWGPKLAVFSKSVARHGEAPRIEVQPNEERETLTNCRALFLLGSYGR